ncbi:MAG: nitrogen fixation protein NifU [Candidatus Peregrinibacteria bacterium Greene0416_19]|nr:MAG: nitrogen fixation protein NifU [Candidatus Peregrinibacteria bacterium Greene0416_19]
MDVYAEQILDHYRHPRGKSRLAQPSISHEEVNHSCGDALTVDLLIQERAIEVVGWDGTGCAISQAGMSMLCEELTGKTIDEVNTLGEQNIRTMLGVSIGQRRSKCALLCLHTLKNAIRKFQSLPPQSWMETAGRLCPPQPDGEKRIESGSDHELRPIRQYNSSTP